MEVLPGKPYIFSIRFTLLGSWHAEEECCVAQIGSKSVMLHLTPKKAGTNDAKKETNSFCRKEEKMYSA